MLFNPKWWKPHGWKVFCAALLLSILFLLCINRNTSGTYSSETPIHDALRASVQMNTTVPDSFNNLLKPTQQPPFNLNSSDHIVRPHIPEVNLSKNGAQLYRRIIPNPSKPKPVNYIDKTSKGEKECRRVAEQKFKKRFIKIRPAFLTNAITGQALELDCYNSDLNLAVEFNGRQHYEYIPFFHKTRDDFVKQQYRDEYKRLLCERNHIMLITVPYNVPSIQNYLLRRFAELGF